MNELDPIESLTRRLANLELRLATLEDRVTPAKPNQLLPIHIPPPTPINTSPSGPLGNIKDLLPRPHKGPPSSSGYSSAGVIAELRKEIDEKNKIIEDQKKGIESLLEDIAKYRSACDYYIRLNFETTSHPQWWNFKGWSNK